MAESKEDAVMAPKVSALITSILIRSAKANRMTKTGNNGIMKYPPSTGSY